MGNIPLPALSVQPPQSALEEFARVAQIGSQIQNQKAQAQEIQMRQQQIADQEATTKAMRDWDPKTNSYDDLAQSVLKNGGSANAATSMQLHGLDVQDKASKLSGERLTQFKARNEQIGNDMMEIADPNAVKDEELHDAARNHVMKYVNAGIMDKQDGMHLLDQINNTTDPTALRQGISNFGKVHLGAAAILAQEKTKAETTEATEKGKQATAEAAKADTEKKIKELELSFGGPPDLQKARYMSVLKDMQSGKTVDPNNLAAAMAYESSEQHTNTTSDNLGVISSLHGGPTALHDIARKSPQAAAGTPTAGVPSSAKGTPGSKVNTEENIIDMIGNYQANPMLISRMLFHHPEVLSLLHSKYPDWDETSYNAKNKLMMGMTSGPQSKELNAISTAMGHVKVLDDSVDALNNNDAVALNKIGNYLGINLAGKTPAAAFKLIVHRVGPEITSAYIPGAGGVNERLANEEDFSENLPPQTLHNNAAVTVKLLRSKVGALENQYKNTIMRDDFQKRFISPEAQAAFDKFSKADQAKTAAPSKTQFNVTPPGSKKTYYFPDQQSLDNFKKEARLP